MEKKTAPQKIYMELWRVLEKNKYVYAATLVYGKQHIHLKPYFKDRKEARIAQAEGFRFMFIPNG